MANSSYKSALLIVTPVILAKYLSNRNSKVAAILLLIRRDVRDTHNCYPVILSQSARSSFRPDVDWPALIAPKRTPPRESAAPDRNRMLDYFVYIMLVFTFSLQLPQYPFPSLLFPSQFFLSQLSTYSLRLCPCLLAPLTLISYQKLVKELCWSSPFPFR